MFNPIRLDAHNPSPMTGSGNHTYLMISDAGHASLVDGGVGDPRHLESIVEQLRDRRARLEQVLITHGHEDHVSGVGALAAAHPNAEFFKYPWPEEDGHHPVAWHAVKDGDAFRSGGGTLVALHTPGHSPDHIAFWHEESRTMFTGDLVVLGGSVMIAASKGGDLAQYMASLERVLGYKPARLLPAHGPEVDDPETLLRGYLTHRLMRERQVYDAIASGHDTVRAIADYIYDGLAPALLPAARENVRAHLDKLTREGRTFDDHGHWKTTP